MDDITKGITELLNSTDGIERIKNVAQSLFKEDQAPKSEPPALNLENLNLDTNFLEGIADFGSISNIMKIVKHIKASQKDKRAELLLALKPHLSKERQARVDKAVSLLKIATILPLLKEEGLLEGLLG